MTPQQQAAHLKLLNTLPVRSHVVLTEEERRGGPGRVRTNLQCAILKKKIRELAASGLKGPAIAKKLGISRQHAWNYLRKR